MQRLRRGRRGLLVAATLIAALGCALRLHDIAGGQLRGDEAMFLLRGVEIASGARAPAIGLQTTDGLPTPPTFVWLVAALVRLVGPEPARVMGAIALLCGLACGGVVLASARAVGPVAATVAGALLAASPGLLLHQRKVSNPDLLLPFAVLALAAALRAARAREARGAGPALFLGALAATIHYSAAACAVAAAVGWLGGAGGPRARVRRRGAWLGLAAALALVTPFLSALASRPRRAPSADATAAADPAGPAPAEERRLDGGAPGRGPLAAAGMLAGALGAAEGLRIAGPAASAAAAGPLRPLLPVTDAALLLAGGAGLGLLAARARPRTGARAAGARVLVAWAATLALPLGLGLIPARSHYGVAAAVVLALGAGVAVARARRALRRRRRAAAALLACVVAFVAAEAALSGRLVAALAERGGAADAPHDAGARHKLALVRRCVDEGLLVVRYPSFDYVLLLDLERRRRGLTRTHPLRIDYWDLDLLLPVPDPVRGRAAIVADPAAVPPVRLDVAPP